jgi:hypothetical protein
MHAASLHQTKVIFVCLQPLSHGLFQAPPAAVATNHLRKLHGLLPQPRLSLRDIVLTSYNKRSLKVQAKVTVPKFTKTG